MIGNILGNRYEILQKIGEGGMSEVYKGRCNLLNRYVAIKILKREFVNDIEFVEKFKREATAVAALISNNIVSIYDVGTEDDINYIVMEIVEGKTLKELINEKGRLNINETLDIGVQIAKALECAHKNGIVHRDIKPQNILVTEEGIVKVTDFGIAKAMNSATITNTNKVMGSAHYFSPEQAKGTVVDFRTDIYSLGVVLYEMLVGKVPYDGDTPVAIALKHIQEPIIEPRVFNKSIPSNMNDLILKSMDKDLSKRYQSIKDMISDMNMIKNNSNYSLDQNVYNTAEFTRIMDPIDEKLLNTKIHNTDDISNLHNEVEEDNEDDYEDIMDDEDGFKEVSTSKKKILKNALIGLIVLLLGMGSAFGIKSMLSKESVNVPNIIGLTKAEAKDKIESKGLKFTVEKEEESDKPKDTVLDSNPKEGEKVDNGSEVKVTISKGNIGDIEVKDFRGLKFSEVEPMLDSLKLKLGDVKKEFNNSVPNGVIISQSLESGEKVKEGSTIDFVVSKGPKEKRVTVPSLSGKTLNQAQEILSSLGLKLSKGQEIKVGEPNKDGFIKSQQPESGSEIKEGNYITVEYYVFDKGLEFKNR
ncbi:Stk1 family PASTA domain-containing Ser/Thr kinase [Hathewaya histolytica]|uniref:non-specific serine/threonine protein kinase n=1 Tax=Hathewaya histolytica TaxID=1498 RepID=A0A4V6Z1A8_HATHI|nr:Stk1 family PASTA domain-containing Ser/Thr kinase [Hathewaya histolytica]VTQ90127.1 serine/threonine kinase [Hathewaya histolytica]